MKLVPVLVAAALFAPAAPPRAAAQEASPVVPAAVSLDLPRVSYAVVDGPLTAPAAGERSLLRIPMPRAARDGAIGGAIAGVVLGGAYGYFVTSICDTGACSSTREGVVVGVAYGAVAGAVVGYVAGRVWDAAHD